MNFVGPPNLTELACQACTAAQFRQEHFIRWIGAAGLEPHFHRQQWELAFVLRALESSGQMAHGRLGLGLGNGLPLVASLVARSGAHVETTPWSDLPDSAASRDFLWSCSLAGHLGSVAAGLDYLLRSLDALKPGGIAVHTFDFNVSSDVLTLESATVSLLRRCDVLELQSRLMAQGHAMLPLNFATGQLPEDQYVDQPPYVQATHLKLQIDAYVVTSFGVVIRKG